MTPHHFCDIQSRRDFFRNCAGGIGTIALWSLLAQEGRAADSSPFEGGSRGMLGAIRPHFAPRAKNVIFLFIALVLMVYVTEVISPRGRRMSYPVKVWSKGIEVHTSFLEEVRGFPGFIPKEDISKLIVRRIEVSVDGKMERMPTNLRLELSSGKVLDLGRRNYHELDKMIR